MPTPKAGPVLAATLLVQDLDHSVAAYTRGLGLQPAEVGVLDAPGAAALGWPVLAGARSAWLANALGERWLRLVECPRAGTTTPFTRYGWFSLEIVVQDVDRLGEALADSDFEIIGPPADLEMSDAIRAMQVVGPAGEVLYLTQVKRAVPPFELPFARCAVDRLFIPVMLCPDRQAALAAWERVSGAEGLCFETRITVLNRAHGLPFEQRHRVAALQLAGRSLIEMDEFPDLDPAPAPAGEPLTGIALIDFACAADHPGANAASAIGAAGERYRLIPVKQGAHP